MSTPQATAGGRDVAVRRARRIEELQQLSDVALEVAGYRDVHPAVLLSVVRGGGYAAGAWDGGRCVGALYGLFGRRDGMPFLHSEMLAVLPDAQGGGVAQRLKLDQRDWALEQGIDLVTWTYDPLRTLNANLNIRRLGCVVTGYEADMYGPLPGFSAGWPTDQLLLEWWVGSPHVARAIAREAELDARFSAVEIPVATRCRARGAGVVELLGVDLELAAPLLAIELPNSIQSMRAQHMDVVLGWRHGVRDAFEHYLSRGYRVAWFLPGRPSRYILTTHAEGAQ